MVATIKIGKTLVGANQPCYVIWDMPPDMPMHRRGESRTPPLPPGIDAITVPIPTDIHINNPFGTRQDLYLRKFSYDDKNLAFIPIIHDIPGADFAKMLDPAALEIPASKVTDSKLIDCVARMGLPVLIDMGLATMKEAKEAMRIIDEASNQSVVLLYSRPSLEQGLNLKAIGTLRRSFSRPAGWVSHEINGCWPPVLATMLGAAVVQHPPFPEFGRMMKYIRMRGFPESENENPYTNQDIEGDGKLGPPTVTEND